MVLLVFELRREMESMGIEPSEAGQHNVCSGGQGAAARSREEEEALGDGEGPRAALQSGGELGLHRPRQCKGGESR